MGILGHLASGEAKYRPIEPPILGKAPSYASIQAVPDRATSGLVNNIQEALQDAAGQQVAGSAVAHARTFLSNQGINLSDLFTWLTESIEKPALMGALRPQLAIPDREQSPEPLGQAGQELSDWSPSSSLGHYSTLEVES
jgi:hypothetical protein